MSSIRTIRENRGFTLIELLVVVAIIALLISILLPTLKRAKDQSKQMLCTTRQKSLYNVANLYAADNRGFIPRAIQFTNPDNPTESGTKVYAFFSSAVLPYLGYTGRVRDFHGMPKAKKHLVRTLREQEIFRCPSYPPEFEDEPDVFSGESSKYPGKNPSHFITSAFSMPYPESVYSIETNDDLEWNEDGGMLGVAVSEGGYEGASRIENMPVEAQPSTKIYITEVDSLVPWGLSSSLRFYSFFRTSHLPFGGHPRIGEDQRHPGGMNATFFDGHAQTLDLHKIDPGYPAPIDERLKWFTILPDQYFGP